MGWEINVLEIIWITYHAPVDRVPLPALTLQIVIKPYRRSISVAGESKTQFPFFRNQMLCFKTLCNEGKTPGLSHFGIPDDIN